MTIRTFIVLPLLWPRARARTRTRAGRRSPSACPRPRPPRCSPWSTTRARPPTSSTTTWGSTRAPPRPSWRTGPGRDGLCPSDDDVLFEDLTDLDAMSYVGDAAFEKLRTYALAHPAPADEAIEGVLFKGWQSEAVVYGVNHATVEALDVIARRPRGDQPRRPRPLRQRGGDGRGRQRRPTALGILRSHAAGWWTEMYAAPTPTTHTYDGVTFDAATEKVALEIANLASNYDLVAHGMYTTGAAAWSSPGPSPTSPRSPRSRTWAPRA